jgi:1-acyl-sn-glycerol-3-phosphate acyltransferase
VEIGLVPLGSLGLTVFGIDLWWNCPAMPSTDITVATFFADPAHWRLIADLLLIGVAGGFYTVPLYALIQLRAEPQERSRIIAANNILNAGFMVVSALFAGSALAAGLSIPQIFLVTALMNVAIALYIYKLVPEFLMRLIVWTLMHTVYRLKVRDLHHIPEQGAAVVICNHVSFVDALIITAACRRPIRFVMDHAIFRIPVLNFVFRENRAIPIASARENPELLAKAYDDIAAALAAGELVGIFPEGAITRDGELAEFKGGVRKIVERTPVPVIPLALRGLWGSFFSRKDGAAMTKPFRRGLWNRVELVAGAAVMPDQANPEHLYQTVLALRGACTTPPTPTGG